MNLIFGYGALSEIRSGCVDVWAGVQLDQDMDVWAGVQLDQDGWTWSAARSGCVDVWAGVQLDQDVWTCGIEYSSIRMCGRVGWSAA